MPSLKAVKSLRTRYIIGLTVIALLVTASFMTMQRIVSEQRNFSKLVNLAGHQSGLSNRIAYFAGLMASTDDKTEFNMAKSQVGRTINKMERAHKALYEGDPENGIPHVTNENLEMIYDDPMIGLHNAVSNYIMRARIVYEKPMEELSLNSAAYVYLTTYGPHVLEPMFDSVVEELETIGTDAILRIEKLEMAIWITTLIVLLLEASLIFYPLEREITNSVSSLQETIKELTHTRQQLLNEQSFLQHVIDGVGDPILVMDPEYQVIRMNQAAKESMNLDTKEIQPMHRLKLLDSSTIHASYGSQYEDTLKTVLQTSEKLKSVHKHRDNNDEVKTFEIVASPLKDDQGNVAGIIEVSRDVSEYLALLGDLKKSHENYEYLAQHDTLTGLPNRLLFNDRLEHAIHSAHRNDTKLAVLFIDLDGFKHINDSFDHSFGDLVLKAVAVRLSHAIREDDTIARMGGDEFTIILTKIDSSQNAALVARKVLAVIQEPLQVDSQRVFLGASIGISVYPKHGTTTEDMIRNADSAMYRAKNEGKNTFRYYSEGMTEKAFERMNLEISLRSALEQNQLELYYQPQFDLTSGKIIGFEALLRWNHPESGMIPPGKFIPVAEDSGLIVPIGEWVLSNACAQMKKWLSASIVSEEALMCINISAKQFNQEKLKDTVKTILRETGLKATNLELEITESTMMESPKLTTQILQQLRNIGTKIAIDDFGTGYSSLSHLKLLPLTKLKIDQSFVFDIPADRDALAIARAIIGLGKSLSLEVLAEGIETRDQKDFLLKEGCDSGQGYLLSKPLPVSDIEKMLFDIRELA